MLHASIIIFAFPVSIEYLLLPMETTLVTSIMDRVGNGTLDALGEFLLEFLGDDGGFTPTFSMADVRLWPVS